MTTATTLAATKLVRAVTDPVVLHDRCTDWAPRDDHDIYDAICRARLHTVATTPLDDRATHATWPELLAYCSTASMDERYVGGPLVLVYTRAFREYLDRWTALDPDDQPAPLNDPVGALGDAHATVDASAEELADDIREQIKADRDRVFRDAYDSSGVEHAVPAAFWDPDADTDIDVSWADTDVATAELADAAATGTVEDVETAIAEAFAAVGDVDLDGALDRAVPETSEGTQYTLTEFAERAGTPVEDQD